MYCHNKTQQSKNRVHISWDILYINSFIESLHDADGCFRLVMIIHKRMAPGRFLLVVATWSLVPWQQGLYKPLWLLLQLAHQNTAEIFKSSPAHSSISASQPTGYWIMDQLVGPQKDCQYNVPYIGNWSVAYRIFYLNGVDGRLMQTGAPSIRNTWSWRFMSMA